MIYYPKFVANSNPVNFAAHARRMPWDNKEPRMSLDKQQVEKIAHLARIALSEEDIPVYAHNLSNILALVEQMNAVDTTGITPMAHPLDATARLRDDVRPRSHHQGGDGIRST